MLQNKTYNGDKSYRMEERICLNDKMKLLDGMLGIREDEDLFFYLYSKAGTEKNISLSTSLYQHLD